MSDELKRKMIWKELGAKGKLIRRQRAAEAAALIWRECREAQIPLSFGGRWRVLPTGQIYKATASGWEIVDKRADTQTEIGRRLLEARGGMM